MPPTKQSKMKNNELIFRQQIASPQWLHSVVQHFKIKWLKLDHSLPQILKPANEETVVCLDYAL